MSRLAVVSIVAGAMIALTGTALATETSREEYKAAVEPICKTNKEESERYLAGVKTLVKEDKLKQAGTAFTKAAAALEKAEKQLAAVPQSTGDEAKLGKWLADVKAEVGLMRRIATKFKAGDKSKGASLAVKLQNNANKANNVVIVFRFNYCHIDPSQYT
jgi:multidrug resistance efflux pump